MKILYVGDVMGKPGLDTVKEAVPKLKADKHIDLVIAQAENLSEGRGTSLSDFRQLQAAGVDFASGGNWSLHRDEILPLLSDPDEPIIRPANYPAGTPGLGYKYSQTPKGPVLVISLLGHVVGRDADQVLDNPLVKADQILKQEAKAKKIATVVNLHGDYSSEKIVIGHYLDGQVSAVVGDHWHVPTADARVLAKGTAHITDVGMCGILDASLGIKLTCVIPRWRDNKRTHNVLETTGRRQFNAVLISVNTKGLADSIDQIQLFF